MSRVSMMLVLIGAAPIASTLAAWKADREQTMPLPYEPSWQPLAVSLLGPVTLALGIVSIGRANSPWFDLAAWKLELQQLNDGIKNHACDLFFYGRNTAPDWGRHVQAMHAQQQTGVATVNGYSGWFPPNEWPFESTKGEVAFGWAALHRGQRGFKTDLGTKANSSVNPCEVEYIGGKLRFQTVPARSFTYPTTIFRRNGVLLVADPRGDLQFTTWSQSGDLPEFRNIQRDGRPVRAERPGRVIKDARIQGEEIRVLDVAIDGSDAYLWRISSRTGRVKGQDRFR